MTCRDLLLLIPPSTANLRFTMRCMTDSLMLAMTLAVGLSSRLGARDLPPYCQSDVTGTNLGIDGYASRDGNRCEGVYRLKLAGGSVRLSLRSLTFRRSSASFKDEPLLQVSWHPLPKGTTLRISVVPLNSPVLYRMDTESEGSTGVFQWPADLVRRRFLSYTELGVVASYMDHGAQVIVACALGPASDAGVSSFRADVLSSETVSALEAFSRRCATLSECELPLSGIRIAQLPARNRDGAFTMTLPASSWLGSGFFALRIAGTTANNDRPPLALSLTVHAVQGQQQ